MSRRVLGMLLAVGLVALAFALRGRRGATALPETPEAAVSAFFDAASRGDDSAYLALVDGALRESLAETRRQLGPARFRDSLRRSAAGIKGLALSRAADQPLDGAALDAELVFADRNERQRITLAPRRGGWLITAISTAATARPLIPYGTPVFEEPPAPPQPDDGPPPAP
jgi:hypothetical protein